MLFQPLAQGAKPNGGGPILVPFFPEPAPQQFLQTVSPFNVVGFIQNATLDPSCGATDPLCGGTITVNGLKIVVPRNLILQMPAFAISWADLFRSAPAPYGPTQSGLAINDFPKPFTTYEVTVDGNRVIDGTGDQYRAALILLSQHSLNSAQGYINFIDYAKNEMWVGSTLAAKTGARVRINTPGGTFGTPDPLADPRFTADEGNPTIRSETGYPMCVPRADPSTGMADSLCPQWNRPKDSFTGGYAKIFTMGQAVAGPAGADGITHQSGYPNPPVKPDPFEQTPFEVGDSVTYSGTLVNDAPCLPGQPASSCQYISAHTIIASLGIFTAPGSRPVYMGIEDQLLGVGGTPNPLFPQEGVERLVMVAFSTDSTSLVDVYAVDVNPCTGAKSYRFYGTADPFGPPVGGVKGRARIRSFIGNYLPPTRDMAVASRTLTGGAPIGSVNIPLIANGLQGGYYQAPTFAFIFPENFGVGNPQVPIAFQEFPFLVNGSGPYTSAGFTAAAAAQATATVGQLNPWPSFNAPPASCTLGLTLLQPPVPNAGPPQTVTSGSTVNLDGSGSSDPNVPALPSINYTWVQIAGPAVSLQNGNAAHPQFIAPTLAAGASPVVLTFQLAVCNGFTCSGTASVNITVVAATAGPSVTLTASNQNPLAGTAVTLTGIGSNGTAPLTYTFAQTGLAGLPAVALTPVAGHPEQIKFTTPSAAAIAAAGLTLPLNQTFTVTVHDSSVPSRTQTATIHVFVGADTLTTGGVVYRASKSRLQVIGVNSTAPTGAANITMTPLGLDGLPIGNPVVLLYDPILDSYTLLADAVNPIPDSVRFTSSFGGTLISPVTKLR
jgi:hypothetical protein